MSARAILSALVVCMLSLFTIVASADEGAPQVHEREAESFPHATIRASLLAYPTRPLLAMSVALDAGLALQVETNFLNVHGVTLQWFHELTALDGGHLIAALAVIDEPALADEPRLLPYVGYGWLFGQLDPVVFGARAGVGMTTNGQGDVRVIPVVKVSVGIRL